VTLNARPRPETPRGRAGRNTVGGAWLGIIGQTVTPKIAQAMHLPAAQRGVLVEKVERGSPADQAGLRGTDKTIVVNGLRVPIGGDIIVALDDKPVTQVQDLQTLIQRAQAGQTIKLIIVRQGKRMRLQVTLMERSAIRP
jgi:serine protease Do